MKAAKNPSVIERLREEMRAQSEGQKDVLEFSFDQIPIGRFTPEIAKLFQNYKQLISVEFSECDLQSLEGFPEIPKLVKLCLESNELKDDSITYIVNNFKDIQFLSLTANQITTLETLKQLSKLESLVQLDLQDNPVAKDNNYTKVIFDSCTKLEILDNHDKEGNEVLYSEDDEDDEEDDDLEGPEDVDDDEEFDEDDDEEESEEPEPKKTKKRQ